MLLFGLFLRFGKAKAWYLTRGVPILIPRAIQNMMIPMGITFLVDGVFDLIQDVETRLVVSNYVVWPMLLLSLLLGIWTPRWLRPRWLVYLEEEYGSVMWHLLEEARKDAWNWEQQVSTHQGLVKWAEETRIRFGYPPHTGQIEREAKKRESQQL